MTIPQFIFGGTTGINSPEELARRRLVAQALKLQAAGNQPKNLGEGIGAVADAISARRANAGLDEAATAGAESAQSAIAKALGGAGAFPAAPTPSGTIAAPAAGPVSASAPPAPEQAVASLTDPSPPSTGGGSWLNYANQGATRNKPLAPKLVDALSFLPEMGVTVKVFSGGQDETGPHRTGSHRHDDGNAGDVFFYKDGRKLDWANPQDLPIFQQIVKEGKARGITGIGAGEGYMQPGSMHIGFGSPSVWGAGGRGANAPAWLRQAYNGGGGPVQVASNDASSGVAQALASPQGQAPAQQAISRALMQGFAQTPQQGPVPQGRPSIAAALNGPPVQQVQAQPMADPLGAPIGTTPAGQRVMSQMMSPLPIGGQASQMQPPQGAPQGMPQQQSGKPQGPGAPGEIRKGADGKNYQYVQTTGMAGASGDQGWIETSMGPQGGPSGQAPDNLPVMAGGNADAIPKGQLPSIQDLMQAAQNPWLNDQQRGVVNMLLKQQMEAQDPSNQMSLEKQRLELEALKNPRPKYDFMAGKDGSIFRANETEGSIDQVYGGKPDTYRTLTQEEKVKMGLPVDGAYQIGADNKVSQIGGGGTTVNIDQKTEGAFDKKLAENQATMLTDMASSGFNAKADLGVINELGGLLKNNPGGLPSGIGGWLAQRGIGGEGMSDLQAADALINKLIPSQRQAGSGSMSDRDVEMFRASLPSLWKSPEGNQKVLQVMQGLAQYKIQQGDIATKVMNGEMTRQEASRALGALPNPLADFGKISDPSSSAGQPKKRLKFNPATGELE